MDNFSNFRKIRRMLGTGSSVNPVSELPVVSKLNQSQSRRLDLLNQIRSGKMDVSQYDSLREVASNALKDNERSRQAHFRVSKALIAGIALVIVGFAGMMSAAATDSLPSSFQAPIASVFKNIGIQLPEPATTGSKVSGSNPITAPFGKSCNTPVRNRISCATDNPGSSTSNPGSSTSVAHNNGNRGNTTATSNPHGSNSGNGVSSSTTTTCVNPSEGSANMSPSSHSTVSVPGSKCSAPGPIK